jgi:hypothetical protein
LLQDFWWSLICCTCQIQVQLNPALANLMALTKARMIDQLAPTQFEKSISSQLPNGKNACSVFGEKAPKLEENLTLSMRQLIMKIMMITTRRAALIFSMFLSFFASQTYGQKTILKNSVDDSLNIKNITVAPLVDNVSQIYGKPLTLQLRSIVEADRQWNSRTFPDAIQTSPEDFEDKPDAVKAALAKANADALLSGRLTKGPKGISIKLNLFLAKDGLVVSQENLQDYERFEIADLRVQLENLYRQMKSRLPYAGTILSRKGNMVTLNLGTLQGVQEGKELSVIQILKVNRHPRFKFVVSTEKEIIGRIHVDKADESLSFGSLVLERSEGVVQPGMKIEPIDFITYPLAPRDQDGKQLSNLAARPDSQVALGERPTEWVPKESPSLGKIGLMLGLGSYSVNNTLNSVGAVNAGQTPTPSIHLDGELWLTTNWFASIGIKQYLLSLSNQYQGSSPGRVSVSSMQTTLQAGYNFLLSDDFFGPKFQVLGGYSKLASTVDTSSPPAYTSLSFSGMALGIAGSVPVSEEMPLTVGAKLMYYLSAAVDESPVTSGASSSAKITSFSAFGNYRWTEHMSFRGELMYDLFSASFSGTGTRGANSASSASHTLTTFAGGIEYLF